MRKVKSNPKSAPTPVRHVDTAAPSRVQLIAAEIAETQVKQKNLLNTEVRLAEQLNLTRIQLNDLSHRHEVLLKDLEVAVQLPQLRCNGFR